MFDHLLQYEDLQGAREEQRRQRLVLLTSQGIYWAHTLVTERYLTNGIWPNGTCGGRTNCLSFEIVSYVSGKLCRTTYSS